MTATTARSAALILPAALAIATILVLIVLLASMSAQGTGQYRLWTTPPEDGRPTSLHPDLAACEKARRFFKSNNPGRKAWCEAE